MSSKETQGGKPADPKGLSAEKLELKKLLELAQDPSPGAAAVIVRETARLHLENRDLKARNLRAWGSVMTLGGIFAFTVVAGVYWFPKYRYIPTTDNHAICEVNTESRPRVSAATVAEYAKETVINSYSYDYVNYRKNLNEAGSRWYTDDGRKAFLKTLDESGNLERVIKGRMTLRSSSVQTAQLEESGTYANGQRFWLVQVPVAIEFFAGGDIQPKSRQEFLAAVTIVEIPASATNTKGIATDSLQLSPFTARK